MIIPHALGYNSITLHRVSFHSLLPSIQITNERDVSEDIKGSSSLHPAQGGQRCLVSCETSLCSGAHCHGTCQTPRVQRGFRRDWTDSRRAVHCWLLKMILQIQTSAVVIGEIYTSSQAFITSYRQSLGTGLKSGPLWQFSCSCYRSGREQGLLPQLPR